MDRVWSILDSSQSTVSKFRALAASSSNAAPKPPDLPRPLKELNDHVFEVVSPTPLKRPSVEVVFFHGLELKGSEKPHVTTWLSRDGSELWLNWILNDIPDARILTVSYDAHAKRTDTQGRTDRYITGENLVHSLTDLGAHVGQDGCPVVLVGHCIGGLVMKEVCLQAHSILSQNPSTKHLDNFLRNLKGLFFYGTPHHGTRLADSSEVFPKGPLFEDATILNTESARRNENFCQLRSNIYGWRTYGVAEGRTTTLGPFKGILVTEGAARHDVDDFYTVTDSDHFEICQPPSKTSSSFMVLSSFVGGIVKQDNAQPGAKQDFSDAVIDRQGEVNTILEKLKNDRRLAIWGMGGIGKSTLAKMVYTKISGSFEYTCFIWEVKKLMGSMVTPKDLQTEIIKHLYAKDRKVDPGTFTWSTLQGKSVLILLDDVNSEYQVRLMTEADGFSQESRVIVTSRDRGFLVPEDFQFYSANGLDDEDSKKLFCLHAFKMANAPNDYEDHVVRFTKKCGGLPLALKVAGRYLCKRSKQSWDDALEKLSRAERLNGNIEDGLWSILEMSYNSLAIQEQEMFLDVAVVFHGKELSWANRIWRLCGWASSDSGWNNLVDKGLVTVGDHTSFDTEGPFIQMHEMLRDLGRKFACPDPQDILGHSRVCCTRQTWPFNQRKFKVKFLKIKWDTEVDFNIFCELDELKVLIIDCHSISNWWGCDRRVAYPPKLAYLEFRGLQRTPKFKSICFIQKLEHNRTLRGLSFEECQGFKTLPRSLGHFKVLQHLRIRECHRLKSLPDSLGGLKALKGLTIIRCGSLEALPDSLGALQALEVLELSYCLDLKALPDSLGGLKALKNLTMECGSLEALPDSLGALQGLEVLELSYCWDLKALPDSLGGLKALKGLTIRECESLEALPDSLGGLKALKGLTIIRCRSLEALPDSLGALQALEVLELSYCRDLKALPDSLGGLRALKNLTMECDSLEALPDSLGVLQGLEVLELSYCPDLKALPDSLGGLKALKGLTIRECESLEALPDSLGGLKALKGFTIRECESLEALPDSLGGLKALKGLTIIRCGSLEALPDSLGALQALEVLELSYCRDLKALPASLGALQGLEVLELSYCWDLKALPDSLGGLKALECLRIRRCDSLKALPDSLGALQALEVLELSYCRDLKALPDSLGGLKALKNLTIV